MPPASHAPPVSPARADTGRRTSPLRSRVFRLTLVHVGLFAVAVLLLVGFIYWSTTDSVTRQIDATIDAEIRGLAEQFGQRGLSGLVASIQRRSAVAGSSRGLYLLADARYQPIAGNLSRWPDERPDAEGWITFPLEFPETEGGGLNFGRARLFDLGDRLHLLVGHDVRERTRIAALIGETLAWGIAGILALSLVGGLLMSRSLLRQIETVNAASREIMAGDLSRRIPVSGRDDEFDRLAGNLNAMLDRIERLLDSVKQVTDNIAHDLRGPLARLRSRLELTLMEGAEAADYRDAIRETIEEADSLLRTFNALLSIARIESGAPSESFAAVGLGALVTDVGELFDPLAEERGLTLAVASEGELSVRGDRNLLFQALANLLDNAVKFSPPGGRLALELRRRGGEALVRVCDQGPGIPPEARERVRERFYRLESSRSTPGSGLGLSLVAAVAELHGGRLLLEDGPDPADGRGGLCALLVLPLKA